VKILVINTQVKARHEIRCRITDNGAIIIVNCSVVIEVNVLEFTGLCEVSIEACFNSFFKRLNNTIGLVPIKYIEWLTNSQQVRISPEHFDTVSEIPEFHASVWINHVSGFLGIPKICHTISIAIINRGCINSQVIGAQYCSVKS